MIQKTPTETGKTLSVKQPWAWAIIHAGKDIENRTWKTSHRGPLLIHAGCRDSQEGWEWLDRAGMFLPVDPPTGGIIGIVDVIDCIRDSTSPWAMSDHWHWVLANPRPLPFEPLKGRVGIFNREA